MDDFKLRGSFQHAVRAPNVLELFTPQAVGLFDWNGDPCGGGADRDDAHALAELPADRMDPGCDYGVTPQSPAGQYNANFGGNAELKPEKADTWTAGIVLTPTFLDGFTMTIDYWNIKVDGRHQQHHPGHDRRELHRRPTIRIRPSARTSIAMLAARCGRPRTGMSMRSATNLGYYKTTGTDFNVNYNLAMGDWGSLNFNELATWLDSFVVQEIPHYGSYDCKG